MLQPMQAGLWLLQGWPPAAGSNVSRLAGARPAWEDADAPTLPLSRPIQSAQQQDQLASSAAPAASGTAPAAGPQGADSEETRPLSRPPIYTRCAALGCLPIRATPATGIDSDDTRPLSRSPAHTRWVRVLSSAGPHSQLQHVVLSLLAKPFMVLLLQLLAWSRQQALEYAALHQSAAFTQCYGTPLSADGSMIEGRCHFNVWHTVACASQVGVCLPEA